MDQEPTNRQIYEALLGFHKASDESFARLEGDVSGLKHDVSILKHDVGELKRDVNVIKSDITVLKHDVTGLKQDVAELKDWSKKADARLDNIERRRRR